MSFTGYGLATRGMEQDNHNWKPRRKEVIDPAIRMAQLKNRLTADAQSKTDQSRMDQEEWDAIMINVHANGDNAEDLITPWY